VFALRLASRLLVLISKAPNPPIRQAHSAGQQSAATQKIAIHFLRLLRFFAAINSSAQGCVSLAPRRVNSPAAQN
jgi:hypothetical protein